MNRQVQPPGAGIGIEAQQAFLQGSGTGMDTKQAISLGVDIGVDAQQAFPWLPELCLYGLPDHLLHF